MNATLSARSDLTAPGALTLLPGILPPAPYQTALNTPIGRVLIEGSRSAITRVDIVAQDAPVGRSNRVLASARKQLREYFKGKRTAFSVPLDNAAGTHFQRAVWRELQAIPIGQAITYHELARRVTGDVKAARAAGRANGANPFMIIVPCHRVIGADGRLTGYRGGLKAKEWLLKHEKALMV